MKTAIEKSVSFSAVPETSSERAIFTAIAISASGVDVYLAEGAFDAQQGVLHLNDSLACAALSNIAAVAHRRMQEIELAELQGGSTSRSADGESNAAAVALGSPHPAPV